MQRMASEKAAHTIKLERELNAALQELSKVRAAQSLGPPDSGRWGNCASLSFVKRLPLQG